MKTSTYQYPPAQYPAPYSSVQYTPTAWGDIFAIMPLFMMILMLSIVMRMVRFMQKPETKAKIEEAKRAAAEAAKKKAIEVEKAALEATKEWALRKIGRK